MARPLSSQPIHGMLVRSIDERTAGDGGLAGQGWGLPLLNTTGMCQAREIVDGGRGQRIPLVATAEYYPGQAHFKGPEADVRMAESCVNPAFCAQETDEPTSLSSKERCTIGSVERFEGRVRSREALHIPRAQTKVRMKYELRV